MKMEGKKTINIGTVFSGIGSPEQALNKLCVPHKILFACDNGERKLKISKEELEEKLKGLNVSEREKVIVEEYNKSGENLMEKSYKANYKISEDSFFQDIRYLDGKVYKGNVDILVGGSPCQAFSCNGKRGGFNDTRGTLFYEYARLINESQPKCFIFENVRGMINHDHGRTWDTIKNVFNELNYKIYIHKDEEGREDPIINAADYGIPQLRMRLYVVGIRKDLQQKEEYSFPKPQELTKTVNDYLDPIVPAKYYLGEKGFCFVTTHPTRAQVGIPIMTCQKANQQFNWNGTFIFEPLSDRHNKDILDRAYVGEWKGQRGVVRMFTPRECLRLMGFPDTFNIVVKDNMMWRQSGNSIVVNVMEAIMRQIINTGILD